MKKYIIAIGVLVLVGGMFAVNQYSKITDPEIKYSSFKVYENKKGVIVYFQIKNDSFFDVEIKGGEIKVATGSKSTIKGYVPSFTAKSNKSTIFEVLMPFDQVNISLDVLLYFVSGATANVNMIVKAFGVEKIINKTIKI